jgi:fatty acid/phospholipid biosynthesis enzyme
MIHSFNAFRCTLKGKEVCSSSELVNVAANSMMEPKSGMMVDETSFSESKGKKKKETKENGKVVVIGVNKARIKSEGKAKKICFYCKEDGQWMKNILSIWHSNILLV